MMDLPSNVSLDDFIARYPALVNLRDALQAGFSLLAEALTADRKLLVCGNGGSAADAEHIVGELVKSFAFARPLPDAEQAELQALYGEAGRRLAEGLEGGLAALSLVSPVALNTAIANDTGYALGFAQQVYALGRPGDVLIAISTSGRSENVVQACRVARMRGVRVLGLTGAEGRDVAALADVAVCVPSEETHVIQEYHLPVYHFLCLALEAHFFGHHGLR